jgi:hypothetical protein
LYWRGFVRSRTVLRYGNRVTGRSGNLRTADHVTVGLSSDQRGRTASRVHVVIKFLGLVKFRRSLRFKFTGPY